MTNSIKKYWLMECPKCADSGDMIIVANLRIRLLDDGEKEDLGDNYGWEPDSEMACGTCLHRATVKDFTTDRLRLNASAG